MTAAGEEAQIPKILQGSKAPEHPKETLLKVSDEGAPVHTCTEQTKSTLPFRHGGLSSFCFSWSRATQGTFSSENFISGCLRVPPAQPPTPNLFSDISFFYS